MKLHLTVKREVEISNLTFNDNETITVTDTLGVARTYLKDDVEYFNMSNSHYLTIRER